MSKTENLAIGQRLRSLRQSRGWTLERLTSESGVSSSNISKIEKGSVAPAFDTLLKIARALDTTLDALIGGEAAETPPMARRSLTPAGKATHFETPLYDYHVHAPDLTTKRMIPLDMLIRTRTVPDDASWSTHEGEEFIYVVSGSIDLYTEHYAPQRLERGESAYFDSAMRHAFVSVGEGDAHVLSICLTRDVLFDDGSGAK